MTTTAESAFDEHWLQFLARSCELGKQKDAGFEDLYLERQLELRFHSHNGFSWVEECRVEGAAARWITPQRVLLQAATGTSPRTMSRLFDGHFDTRKLGLQRPHPSPELDVPRGWRARAEQLAATAAGRRLTMRLLLRRAAVVRPGEWLDVRSPLLVRLELDDARSATYLAVWDRLETIAALAFAQEPPSRRPFRAKAGEVVPVLFSQGTGGVLFHELVGHLLEGDLVAAGASPLQGAHRPGGLPRSLHIVDDPTRFDLPGAFSCDDEGVQATPIVLIDGGEIAGTLCDRATAAALERPPGRGRRSSWSSPPVPRLSNLVVAPGSVTVDDLRNDIQSGLEVCGVTGASVDPDSGRAVIRVERGWELRHGRRRRQLAPCELTGTVQQLLSDMALDFGNDPTSDVRLGWCVKDGQPLPTGSEAPSLLIQRMAVL